jgi:hypothetical protein
MIRWYRQPGWVDTYTELVNNIFTFIFIGEAIIKLIGIGLRNYFKINWNIFDFIVAMGSIVGLLLTVNTSLTIKWTTVLRAFRILRLLRLLRRGGKNLYLIFNTFIITLTTLMNIGSLLILVMYIYSIVGMIYFGDVKRNGNMNEYINFESFTRSFITLFTIATVDTWHLTTASFTHGFSEWNSCIENPTYQDYVESGY